jgi:hypothetical protein
MKIAFCLYGQIRSFDLIKESLKLNLMDAHNPDIFIHFWNLYDNNIKVNEGQFNHENGVIEYGNFNESSIDEILNLLKPKIFKVDEPMSFAKNTESMFYSIEQSNKLKLEYEERYKFKYDLVIVSRFDLYHNSNLELIENDSINVINRPGGCDGLNDWFFYGNSKVIDLVSKIYSSYKETDRIKERCPEGMISDFVSDNNISVNHIEKTFDIIRKNGIRV